MFDWVLNTTLLHITDLMTWLDTSSVIRHKGKTQNVVQEPKARKIFQKTNISYSLYAPVCVRMRESEMFVFRKIWRALFSCNASGFKLAIRELRFADQPYHFADHFKLFFVKYANQNFPSVGIFVFRETTKFLYTLQACHTSAYLKLLTGNQIL